MSPYEEDPTPRSGSDSSLLISMCYESLNMPIVLSPEDFFHALADETRLRCLLLLQQHEELCVCELTYALKMIQPKVSRHLATLKTTHLVRDRREGTWIFYRLHPELPFWAKEVLQTTMRGIGKASPFYLDQQTLAQMPNRPRGRCG